MPLPVPADYIGYQAQLTGKKSFTGPARYESLNDILQPYIF
jgi:hypothetical protein